MNKDSNELICNYKNFLLFSVFFALLILNFHVTAGTDMECEDIGDEAETCTVTHAPDIEVITVNGEKLSDHLLSIDLDDYQEWLERSIGPKYYGSSDSDGSAEDKSSCPTIGNPVVKSNGNKVQTELDYVGPGQHPLEIRRYYNHLSTTNAGGFGKNWRASFEYDLFYFDEYREVCDEDSDQYDENLCDDGKVYPDDQLDITVLGATGANRVFSPAPGNNKWSESLGGELTFSATQQAFTLISTNGIKLVFDRWGVILSKTWPSGISHTYTYPYNGITVITHTSGASLTITRTSIGITSIKDSLNNLYSYEYTPYSLGHLQVNKVTYPSGDTKKYLYTDTVNINALTQINVNNSVYGKYTYYADGKTKASGHGSYGYIDKHSFAYQYFPESKEYHTEVTNPLGQKTIYVFQTRANKRLLTDIIEQSSTIGGFYCANTYSYIAYDINGFFASKIHKNGTETKYTYNSKGQKITEINGYGSPAPYQIDYAWHPTFSELPIQIESSFLKQEFTYDTKRRITQIKNTSKVGVVQTKVISFTYTDYPNGITKLVSIDGARTDVSDITEIHYNTKGQRTKIVNALGHTTFFNNYDANGFLLSQTNPNGSLITYAYANNRLSSVTTSGLTTTFTHNAMNAIDKVTYPDGSYEDATFDEAFRILRITDNNGDTRNYSYNSNSQVLTTYFKRGSYTHFLRKNKYDGLGQLREVLGNNGQKTEYNYKNDLIEDVSDALGNITDVENNEFGLAKHVVDAEGNTTHFSYNDQKLLESVTDPKGNTTTYLYNGFGNVISQNSPDTGITTYSYNPAGNLIGKQDANGNIFSYSYDALNRLTSKTEGSLSATFAYDENGDTGFLTSTANQSGYTEYSYSEVGALTKQRSHIEGQTYDVNYSYYPNGKLKNIFYPSGNIITYYYDVVGRINRITSSRGGNVIYNVGYKSNGPANIWTFGNGLYRSITYDQDFRITGINTYGKQSLQFGYDFADNIVSVSNQWNLNYSYTSMDYDAINRLLFADIPAGDLSFSYDYNGNKESKTVLAYYDYVVDPQNNRLTSIKQGTSTHSLLYDNNGNRKSENDFSGNTVTYTYNGMNQLASLYKSNATTSYKYDSFDRRVYKTNGTETSRYIYSSNNLLLAEPNSGREYIYFNDQVVGYLKNNNLYYVHNDQLGRPEVLTDSNDVVVWKANLKPFSRQVQFSSVGDFNLGFPGHYYDKESGLFYNIARYYDSTTGRYIQSDPTGLAGGLNTYEYVESNPITMIDTDGLRARAINPWNQYRSSMAGRGFSQQELSYMYREMQFINRQNDLNRWAGPRDLEFHQILSNGPDYTVSTLFPQMKFTTTLKYEEAVKLGCTVNGICKFSVPVCRCLANSSYTQTCSKFDSGQTVGPSPENDPNCACSQEVVTKFL